MDKRVKFDFEVEFSNGGSLRGSDFRLDIPGDDIADPELEAEIVRDLRLLMVGRVRILHKQIITEPHKRSGGFVDLSHAIHDGLVTYKGIPAPVICDYLSREDSRDHYAPGTEFQIARIDMVANTGTYVDCPFHRYADGEDLAQVGIERFADLEAAVVRADYRKGIAVSAASFTGRPLMGLAVLVHTGWDEKWATEAYFENHSFLTEEGAIYLRDSGVRLVGIDSMNIDDTRGKSRPVHSTLLRAGILIVEHLCNLGDVPDSGFRFSAVPPKFEGVGTFPVRAFATL